MGFTFYSVYNVLEIGKLEKELLLFRGPGYVTIGDSSFYSGDIRLKEQHFKHWPWKKYYLEVPDEYGHIIKSDITPIYKEVNRQNTKDNRQKVNEVSKHLKVSKPND